MKYFASKIKPITNMSKHNERTRLCINWSSRKIRTVLALLDKTATYNIQTTVYRICKNLTVVEDNSVNPLTIFYNRGLVIEERFLGSGRIPRTVVRCFIRQVYKKTCEQKHDTNASSTAAMRASSGRHWPKVMFINLLLRPVHSWNE